MKFAQAVVALLTLCHVPAPVSASLVEARSLQGASNDVGTEKGPNDVGADFKKETTPAPTPQPTAPPTPTPCFTMTFSSALTSDGRIFRNGTPSDCSEPKSYPGLSQEGDNLLYEEVPVTVSAAVDSCVTIDWFLLDGCIPVDTLSIHPSAYSDFDPLDQSTGYLGDLGGSDLPQFSFALNAGEDFILVLQQNFFGLDPLTCTFEVCLTVEPL